MANFRVVFSGTDTFNHDNLWVTDGTAAGTSELTRTAGYTNGVLYNGLDPSFAVVGSKAFFKGYDAGADLDFWVTDGTSGGTSELAVTGAYSAGLLYSAGVDPDFTVIGSKTLFRGVDAAAHAGLWVTDGTSSGTSELQPAGAYSGGLFAASTDPSFTALAGRALFEGYDTGGRHGLWVTDGTLAGTSEVQGVTGAYTGGLLSSGDPGFTVLAGKALFAGTDSNARRNLWVTDGTTAGTSELTPAGTSTSGLLVSVGDPHFTLFGGEALFKGVDNVNDVNLWVTDGTTAGTSELTVSGVHANGLFYHNAQYTVDPDFTVFGNKVLFIGEDAGADVSLWVSDGTGTGTSELNVASANSHGLFYNGTVYATPDFTIYGNKTLFTGFDSNGHVNLWVTDGTSGGTSELTVANAAPSGLFFNNSTALDPQFIVAGDRVLFAGYDVNGHVNLWSTDGTSGGTSELSVGGAYSGGLSPGAFALILNSRPSSDFNADGKSDIVWQNNSGQAYVWEMNGTSQIGGDSLGNPGSNWRIEGTGDFNADSRSDILWQNVSGEAYIWELNGTSVIGQGSLGNPGPSWDVKGSGDFNGDGKSDVLWQNANGEADIWELNGTSVIGQGSVGNPGPSWHVEGSGDFNGDGKSDILWQNDSGEAYLYEMNGTTQIGGASLGNPGPSWHVIGSGDFNGDGYSDILWQNDSGQVYIWEMNGTTQIGGASLGNPGPAWHALGTGDYNGDGKSDILFQNSSGEGYIWEMNGTSQIGGGSLGNPGSSWHELGLPVAWPPPGDFNDDGYSDILFQNSSGQGFIWELSGTSVIASGSLGNPGPSWHEIGTGDFGGDGRADILWQNTSGEAYIYEMSGRTQIGGGSLGNPGADWHAIGTGDFNADGNSDILWQNTSGEVFIWEMNKTSVIGSGSLGNPGADWHALGTGDFNGDGYSDILFQNTSGQVFIWEMNGTSVIGSGSPGNPGADWHAKGTGDFNGDGYSDILFQNTSGEVYVWEMNGTTQIGGGSLGNPGADWHALHAADYNGDGRSDILFQNASGEVAVWLLSGTNVLSSTSLSNPGQSWHVI